MGLATVIIGGSRLNQPVVLLR